MCDFITIYQNGIKSAESVFTYLPAGHIPLCYTEYFLLFPDRDGILCAAVFIAASVLYFNEHQYIAVYGYNIDLTDLYPVISGQYLQAFLFQASAGQIFIFGSDRTFIYFVNNTSLLYYLSSCR